jgi:methylated-DNA-[protein]-cysteine S-methyltransferase
MTRYAKFTTPLGTVQATAEDGFLTSVDFIDAKYAKPIAADWAEDPDATPLKECAQQLREYFDGQRESFDLPTLPVGTAFQQRVWREISRVPFGATITYSELAKRSGAGGSARAAGAATGRNPIAVIVPCHRIVGADGSLTGYAGGLERKTKLLEIEGVLQGSLI